MPVRPPFHRPVGRREKRERDRDYQRKRDPVARALYRSKRWQTERAAFLHDHPLCGECDRHGVIRPASVVDHIDPHGGDEAVFWDRNRWQALCASCHGKKTASHDGGFGNARRCSCSLTTTPGEVKSLRPLRQGPRATKNASVAKMEHGGVHD